MTVDRLTLENGCSVHVRRLRRSDRAMYRDAVAGLSARSRYLRFASPIPRISESLLNQMMELDRDEHVAYAALTPDEQEIVGVARFVRTSEDPDTAEVAIAIADEWQRGGLGTTLLATIIERARMADLSCLVANTLAENVAAARLARACGFSLSNRAGTFSEYQLLLDGAP